jgi:Bacterial capsule synthesis protein PGA_cap
VKNRALMLILVSGILAACSSSNVTPTATSEVNIFVPVVANSTPTAFQPTPGAAATDNPAVPYPAGPPAAAATAGNNATETLTLWLPPYLSASVGESLTLPDVLTLADRQENASLQLGVGDDHPVSQAVYALVAPFPTLEDGVEAQEVRKAWRGNAEGPFAGNPLMVDESTLAVFSALWGEPAQDAVQVLGAGEILDRAWEKQRAWALIPFDSLEPRWKVLQVGSVSPLWKDFDPLAYPLSVPLSLSGDEDLVGSVLALYGPQSDQPLLPPADRDPNRLTTVMLTGVTALVRATAWTMERQGITYPAQDIGPWLREADILHISNEIPFAANCPAPNPTQVELRFCSDPRYIELMDDVGTDVVELTGDHFQDWGPEAMYLTLDMYKERNWPYYGGGENLQDGRKAVTLEHNGNRIAFIGCNRKGGGYAGATDTSPGAVPCDYDWMYSEIARLRDEGYLPIVTFQHFEYYTYYAQPDQIADAEGMADAGAAIVSGSQAHHPQAFEFYGDAFIHHGLGNLFFDQLTFPTNGDIAFIDRHVLYKGRHISTELLTIKFVDYARPRPMTPEERTQLLQNAFRASGW